MGIMKVFLWLFVLSTFSVVAKAVELNEVESENFELTLTNNQYVVMLFYDDSPIGQRIKTNWEAAAGLLHVRRDDDGDDGEEGEVAEADRDSRKFALHGEAEMAMIDGTDAGLTEVLEMYQIEVPSVKVFRKGILHDFRGPIVRASEIGGVVSEEIASYISQDSLPSVTVLTSMEAIRSTLSRGQDVPIVLGFFAEEDIADVDIGGGDEGYDMSPWGQYQAAADALRGHASLYLLQSAEARKVFNVESTGTVYLLSDDRDSLVPYTGDILEVNLSEWVLRNASPKMGRLHLTSPAGELYATQFFSSRRVKFILFLRPEDLLAGDSSSDDEENGGILAKWGALSSVMKGRAVFAYMVGADVPDVLDYFSIKAHSDLPMIAAHDPSKDARYKSASLGSRGVQSAEALYDYVTDVLEGRAGRELRSAPTPPEPSDPSVWGHGDDGGGQASKEASVPQLLVGSNVVRRVSTPGKDVLLLLHRGPAHKYKAELELLARAVAAEPRVVVAKIDLSLNDVPTSWEGVAGTVPGLLWFRAADKNKDKSDGEGEDEGDGESTGGQGGETGKVAAPTRYWQAGMTLQEMLAFVQRQSSFEASTLRVASLEQLGMLLQELDSLTVTYDDELRVSKRNDGRIVYESPGVDYLAGEIVFDGKRGHVAVLLVLGVLWGYSLFFAHTEATKAALKRKPKKE